MPQVNITDTILRDAHQCLIATRLQTPDMLPICSKLDQVGFWSLEAWGGATYDACIRFLKEDPWERLRKLRQALPNTRIQMLLRGQNLLGYRHYSDDVVSKFVELSAHNGVDVFRIFDALNDVRNLRVAIESVKKMQKHAQGAICYTTSPVHHVDQFVAMALALESLGCDSIAIKDMAGLLTPYKTVELVNAISAKVNLPLHLHSHATAGLAAMCHLKAIEHGCYHIDTAISAFAEGASHTATESMVAALKNTPYDTGLDLALLQDIALYFRQVRKKYHRFESEYTGMDVSVQINQLPGGMISNLAHQLREQGALERMPEVLLEVPRVREDLGFPPLVTPTSQIVGTQALLNVLTATRYKTITNEVKLYLQGKYGRAPGPINAMVRQQAIGNEDHIECRPADLLAPELDKLRQEIAALAKSAEDVMSYAMFPDVGRDFLENRNNHKLKPEPLEIVSPPTLQEHLKPVPVTFNATLHGETYHIKITGTGHKTSEKRPFYVTVDGISEEILLETLEEVMTGDDPISNTRSVNTKLKSSQRPKATQPGHVTTSMPGIIVDIHVKIGDNVTAGDPVLVTEAMKMETEIQAPITGTVVAVHIQKGDNVNPDEALIEIKAA